MMKISEGKYVIQYANGENFYTNNKVLAMKMAKRLNGDIKIVKKSPKQKDFEMKNQINISI